MDYKSLQIKTKKATSILQMKIFAYRANISNVLNFASGDEGKI